MKFLRLLVTAAMVLNYTVTWDLEFSAMKSTTWQPARQMSRSFKTQKEAEDFIKHQPKSAPFECVESWYGEKGYCIVSNVKANWR